MDPHHFSCPTSLWPIVLWRATRTIPSGIRTIINARAIARDPNYWESPEEFMPERFMEGGSAAAMDYRGNDYVFLPFGSGRRKCPGINFAILTIELMLANLVYHFNWELRPESAEKGIDMTESFGSTVHRINSLFLAPVLAKKLICLFGSVSVQKIYDHTLPIVLVKLASMLLGLFGLSPSLVVGLGVCI